MGLCTWTCIHHLIRLIIFLFQFFSQILLILHSKHFFGWKPVIFKFETVLQALKYSVSWIMLLPTTVFLTNNNDTAVLEFLMKRKEESKLLHTQEWHNQISPYNISIFSCRKVMKRENNINEGILFDWIPTSQNKRCEIWALESAENLSLNLEMFYSVERHWTSYFREIISTFLGVIWNLWSSIFKA